MFVEYLSAFVEIMCFVVTEYAVQRPFIVTKSVITRIYFDLYIFNI